MDATGGADAVAGAVPACPRPGVHVPRQTHAYAVSPRRLGWAHLLARVFAVDVTVCRKCGEQMRILDVVRDPVASPAPIHAHSSCHSTSISPTLATSHTSVRTTGTPRA